MSKTVQRHSILLSSFLFFLAPENFSSSFCVALALSLCLVNTCLIQLLASSFCELSWRYTQSIKKLQNSRSAHIEVCNSIIEAHVKNFSIDIDFLGGALPHHTISVPHFGFGFSHASTFPVSCCRLVSHILILA